MRREVILVMGKTGCGKSWWSKYAVRGSDRLIVYDPLQSPEYRVTWYDDGGEDFEEELKGRQYRVGVWDPDIISGAGSFAFAYGPNTFVMEEFSTITEKGQRPPEWLRRLIFLGRHQAVSLLAVAQRPASIPIELRSQASRIVTFAQHEDADTDWLADFLGDEAVDELPRLARFECFDYKVGGEIDRYSIKPLIQSAFKVNLSKNEEAVVL